MIGRKKSTTNSAHQNDDDHCKKQQLTSGRRAAMALSPPIGTSSVVISSSLSGVVRAPSLFLIDITVTVIDALAIGVAVSSCIVILLSCFTSYFYDESIRWTNTNGELDETGRSMPSKAGVLDEEAHILAQRLEPFDSLRERKEVKSREEQAKASNYLHALLSLQLTNTRRADGLLQKLKQRSEDRATRDATLALEWSSDGGEQGEVRRARHSGSVAHLAPHHRFQGALPIHEQSNKRKRRNGRNYGYFGLTLAERSMFDDDASFFISIAQYRDIFCPNTVYDIYKKARNPRRIFCGISDQRFNSSLFANSTSFSTVGAVVWDGEKLSDHVDGTCVPWYEMAKCRTGEFCITDNVRSRKLWPTDAKGPTLGRYFTMLLYQGESYYVMIDSHSRFVMNWDALLITNLLLVPKAHVGRAVLSHYPNGFVKYSTLISQRSAPFRMVMCSAHYTDAGILRMRSDSMHGSGFPERQPFSAGGFVAGDAAFVHEVPFDPYLYYVFDGEEILYSIRLWTAGWEMFTPKNNLLFHHYARHQAPRFWSNKSPLKASQSSLGQQRLHYFMENQHFESNRRMVDKEQVIKNGANKEEDIYGLGKARSLTEYRTFAAIDPYAWEADRIWCRNNQFFANGSTYKYHPIIDNIYGFSNGKADSHKQVRYIAGPMKKPKQRLEKEKIEKMAKNITATSTVATPSAPPVHK